jgi:SAM-dependent methyltransferase
VPTDHDYWDGIADQADALPAGWRHHARRAHLALVEEWIGAPTGLWLKTDLFEERSPDRALLPSLASATWIGSDLSPRVARAAARRGTAVAVATDVRALPFATGTIDGILSTSTLDHFDDVGEIDASLAELRRVLAPGGWLVLTLDNARNPLIRLRNALPRRVARRTGLVPFTVGATHDAAGGRAALERAGFDVAHTTHLLHAPHVIGTRLAAFDGYTRRVLPRIDRLASTRVAPFSGHFVAFCATPRGS